MEIAPHESSLLDITSGPTSTTDNKPLQTYLVTGSDNYFEGLGLARATIFGHDGSRSPIIGTPARPPRERHSGCCGAAHACQMSSVTSVAQELASWTSWGSLLIDHAGDAFKRKPRQCKDAELVASW